MAGRTGSSRWPLTAWLACDRAYGIKPVPFKTDGEEGKKRKVELCGCKYTNTPPYCDGTVRNKSPCAPPQNTQERRTRPSPPSQTHKNKAHAPPPPNTQEREGRTKRERQRERERGPTRLVRGRKESISRADRHFACRQTRSFLLA
jgi:hypothetical protein